MVRFNTVYNRSTTNASAIAVSSTTNFGNTKADRDARRKHGSYSDVLIVQNGTGAYRVLLDGLTTRATEVPSTSSFELKADQGIFFDWVAIENPSATDEIAIDDLQLTFRISKQVSR